MLLDLVCMTKADILTCRTVHAMVKIGIQAGPEMGDHACLSPSFLRMHGGCLYLEVGGRIREVLVH